MPGHLSQQWAALRSLETKPKFLLAMYMLQKIIKIKNTGRFLDAGCRGDTTFAEHTLIYGANGLGKSTLCAILRSLQTGDSSHVEGRQTLGATDTPHIQILTKEGLIKFNNGGWSEICPNISIFDGNFVNENVYAGDIVDTDQKRNLYRIIVGEAGLSLAEQEKELAQQSRTKTSEITSTAKAIQTHLPQSMTFEAFLSLPSREDVDEQIYRQEATVSDVQHSAKIKATANFTELNIPIFPSEFSEMLRKTVHDIADNAEQLIDRHIATHRMRSDIGKSWLEQGIDYADAACPFCGQSVEGSSLITAYKAVFSESYKVLRNEIASMSNKLNQDFGEVALAQLNTFFEKHKSLVTFWSHHCQIDDSELTFPESTPAVLQTLKNAAYSLLEKKQRDLLEAVATDNSFLQALANLSAERTKIDAFNYAIRQANESIATKKDEVGTTNITEAQNHLRLLRAVKTRHSSNVAALCETYGQLVEEKNNVDSQKKAVRQQLDIHTHAVVAPYESRINQLLYAFNAGFTISETKHSYSGGVATSTYQLVINQETVEIGGGSTPNHQPSFKNTLSAGDRSILALSFFLAHLENDDDLDNKIVVFDDPFNSQDAFRRRQTIHEIIKIASKCSQVIVLSHDVTFLKQVWAKCLSSKRKALKLADYGQQGSKITELDLDTECQGRTATDIDHLQAYVTIGTGEPIDVIRKMRTVIEMHLKTTYQGHFDESNWLGDMIGKIRDEGSNHPAHFLYDELDVINDYTSSYHHGENVFDATPDLIDSSELRGYAQRTLHIVRTLQE